MALSPFQRRAQPTADGQLVNKECLFLYAEALERCPGLGLEYQSRGARGEEKEGARAELDTDCWRGEAMADSAEQAHASKSEDGKAGEGKEAPAPSQVGGEASSGSAAAGAAPAAEGGAPAAATAGGSGEGGKELTEEEQRAIRRANRKRKSGWEVVPDPVQPSTLSAGDAAVLALQQQQQALSQAAQSAILQRASVPLPAGMSLATPG